eukprot:TRINITY_DN11896_c0_g1_i1.p1 TRINITY_DN11896_c0_g1~~TRINITY_DN11896_c0_g1_i1.p1  ORF type:complete len:191 (+),score=23.42 TRINITY_DN11896_c0_g1_i1:74-574(+)
MWRLPMGFLVVLGVWCSAPMRAAPVVTTCSRCWARGEGAVLPAGQDPEYFPGRASGGHTCPREKPFVSGGTGSCGCMKNWHNKPCNQQRCCRAKYECYGNCGDVTALYIFLLCLVGFLGLAAIGLACRAKKRRKTQTVATEAAHSSLQAQSDGVAADSLELAPSLE